VAVAQTRRALFAKKLIDETRLPFASVAAASGFASVRRFNDAVRATYGRAPRELRRGRGTRNGSDLVLRLSYRPPFDWRALLDFLGPRALPGVESVSADGYARAIGSGRGAGWLAVRHEPEARRVVARVHVPDAAGLIDIAQRVRRIFDLAADPQPIREQLGADPDLRPLVRRRPGVRVPGGWDGFELAARAILGQQVTVRGATTLAGRLVQAYGDKLDDDPERPRAIAYLFPRPEVLAGADLTAIGLPRGRAAAISTVARAVADGGLRLDAAPDLDGAIATLGALPGIGEWTAHYVAMRALREPDAFPAGDHGLRQALARGAETPPTRSEVLRRAEPWRPWRAYAAMHLWRSLSSARPERRT
jgi:AraC family transcriptional regulator of adaptative response / DNA-3-methyladenine glycosylase II